MAYPANMTVGQIRELVENPGQPIRQPAVSLFTVDTADRYKLDAGTGRRVENTKINDLYINKQQNLMNGYITRIALTEINIPWDIPNVNDYNNAMSLGLVTSTSPLVITPIIAAVSTGFYTPDELATALETALNAAVATAGASATFDFTVTYDDVQANFTIENTLAGLWTLTNFIISTGQAQDDLTTMMGFNAVPRSTPATYKTLRGGYASMLYTPYFDIVSRQLTKKQNINDNSTSVVTGNSLLARIYITPDGIVKRPSVQEDILGCRPFTIHKEFQNPKQIYWDTKEFISVVDLQLIDYKGRVLYEEPLTVSGAGDVDVDLGTGNDNWQMTFQITET